METKKSNPFKKYALTVGIAAGFVFLAALFTVLDSDASALGATLAVGVCACSVSIFRLSMEEKKSKSCNTPVLKD